MRTPISLRRGLLAFASIMLAAMRVGATTYSVSPSQMTVGAIGEYVTREPDTLLAIARNNDLGYTQLVIANPKIDPWVPGAGKHIVLPEFYLLPDVPREGIVISLAQQRLYYYPPGGQMVETFPIGVGVQGWVTPVGVTRVGQKEIHPAWYPPASIRAEEPNLPNYVLPGRNNPLGDYAMRLGDSSYLIHGTNRPYGIGRNVSHGCIHLYPEDIKNLFPQIPIGTPVRVINQHVITAWIGKDLYVAVFPTKAQTDAIDSEDSFVPDIPANLVKRIVEAIGKHQVAIDWRRVTEAGLQRNGIPVRVATMDAESGSTDSHIVATSIGDWHGNNDGNIYK